MLDAWATVDGAAPTGDGTLALTGVVRPALPDGARLELRRQADFVARRFRIEATGAGFLARVPLEELASAGPPPDDPRSGGEDEGIVWQLAVLAGGRRLPVLLGAELDEAACEARAGGVALACTPQGDAALVERAPRAVLTGAQWTGDGRLKLEGKAPATARDELVLRNRDGIEEHAFPLEHRDGSFVATIAPGRVESLAGTLPLRQGTWWISVRRADGLDAAPVMVGRTLLPRLPLGASQGCKSFALGANAQSFAALAAERDLADLERGPYHQRRLRTASYHAQRDQPVREAVVFFSFGGRQYSDSPRAIHEELVRRQAQLDHLWVVRDGACEVPSTATALRKGSREYHEALARARFVVTNDHLPGWFRRREGQVCLQTLHGVPLRRTGFDLAGNRGKARRLLHALDEQVSNWQYVVSPNPYATPILRGAYGLEEELIETGLPRTDVLAGPENEARRLRVRGRLGLPDDARVVLYAPTYRDDAVDRRGRYRLDLRVELERLQRAAGDDAFVLFRKHPFINDATPRTDDRRVLDVSTYPDATELLLVADVLITDYSSMMVDFAVTGRPMLFFAYDLEAYRNAVRGFYVDFADVAPGPLLETAGELTDALRDPDGACRDYAERYERFAATFCELDDGKATGRVVDRVFG